MAGRGTLTVVLMLDSRLESMRSRSVPLLKFIITSAPPAPESRKKSACRSSSGFCARPSGNPNLQSGTVISDLTCFLCSLQRTPFCFATVLHIFTSSRHAEADNTMSTAASLVAKALPLTAIDDGMKPPEGCNCWLGQVTSLRMPKDIGPAESQDCSLGLASCWQIASLKLIDKPSNRSHQEWDIKSCEDAESSN